MRHLLLCITAAIVIVACENPKHQATRVSGADAESVYLTNDHEGHPVLAWTEKKGNDLLQLCFAISGDDGESFGNKIAIPLDPKVATHAEGMPKVAFKKNGTILIVYEKKSPTATNKYAGSIHYKTSTDHGETWSKERAIHRDTASGRSRSYFDVELLPDGEIGVAWLDIKLNQETGGRCVLFAKTNKTNTFVDEIMIDSSACQCCRLDLYTDINKNIYVAYRGLRKGPMGKKIRDMMIATSFQNGSMFSEPINISADQWNLDGCPHTGPSLCSNKAGLFTMWYTEGNGSGIYYAHKTRDDDNFFPRELVSSTGHHPQVDSNGDEIAMLWEENAIADGKTSSTIHYRLIKNGVDVHNEELTPKDGNAFVPVLTHTRDAFVVAYLMEIDHHVSVFFTKP